jgi:hypothetical protein
VIDLAVNIIKVGVINIVFLGVLQLIGKYILGQDSNIIIMIWMVFTLFINIGAVIAVCNYINKFKMEGTGRQEQNQLISQTLCSFLSMINIGILFNNHILRFLSVTLSCSLIAF